MMMSNDVVRRAQHYTSGEKSRNNTWERALKAWGNQLQISECTSMEKDIYYITLGLIRLLPVKDTI